MPWHWPFAMDAVARWKGGGGGRSKVWVLLGWLPTPRPDLHRPGIACSTTPRPPPTHPGLRLGRQRRRVLQRD